jgi:hypothetical protein
VDIRFPSSIKLAIGEEQKDKSEIYEEKCGFNASALY